MLNWLNFWIQVPTKTPFYLKKGQQPDLIKLHIVLAGSGTVWSRNFELLKAPFKG